MKHALVGVVLHNMTGQKLTINILFKLGSSCSYDRVCEIETGLAELSKHFQDEGQMLPLEPGSDTLVVPTISCMDNFDNSIGTVAGHGTIHVL